MSNESLLLTIEGSFTLEAVVGLLLGILLPRPKTRCLAWPAVPLAAVFSFVGSKSEHPDKLRFTSALNFMFEPIWSSLGDVAGNSTGTWLRRFSERHS